VIAVHRNVVNGGEDENCGAGLVFQHLTWRYGTVRWDGMGAGGVGRLGTGDCGLYG
jgi:hypothetical protein